MEDTTKNTVDVFFESIKLLAVAISAVWAYFRFRKEDPLRPRIEFDLGCTFFGPVHNSYLASFTLSANNKGNVEHQFTEIRLRVKGIKRGAQLTEFKQYAPMVDFSENVLKVNNIVPEKFLYYFVRPGVNQLIHYAAQVPSDIQYIIVRATFKYQSLNEIHTAEKVFEVKANE